MVGVCLAENSLFSHCNYFSRVGTRARMLLPGLISFYVWHTWRLRRFGDGGGGAQMESGPQET